MSDEFTMTISIPTDDDGYVLLKCPKSVTYFTALPADLQAHLLLSLLC